MCKYYYGIIAIVFIAIGVTASCVGGKTSYPATSDTSKISREQELVTALNNELAARGINPERAVSMPPLGECNKPVSVQAIPDGSGGWLLSWRYVNHGDYNKDGTVDIADITPLAVHFGESNAAIGGDGADNIGIWDITPIAQHFATKLAGFLIETAPSADGPFEELGRVSLNELVEVGGWPAGRIPLAAIDNKYYRVTPYDTDESLGASSDLYTPTLSAPNITAVRPLTCCSGIAAQLQADVTGEGLKSYAWDFGVSATPNTSVDEHPSVIFPQAGDIPCSLTVTTVFGSDQFDFTVKVVESGDAPYINSVQPTSAIVDVPVVFGAIAGGAEPLNYSWSFVGGQPSISTETNPEVKFSAPGEHQVSLTVANSIGSEVYTFYIDAVQGLQMELVAIRIRIEDTKNTLVGSIYKDKDQFAMPLSGNAQGEGSIGCTIHGYLERFSYNYLPDLPEEQMYGFDDDPPTGQAAPYNATLEYLKSKLEWSISLAGYPESELITHDLGELPGELLGPIGIVNGSYTIKAELPAGVLGLAQPMQIIIDMNFIDGGE